MFDLSDTYARRCREYERLYLSAALKYPYEAIDAALSRNITVNSFAYAEHRIMFRWVCGAAETGKVHTFETFKGMNRRGGHPVPSTGLKSFWWLEIVSTGLNAWAGRIRDLEITRLRIDRFARAAVRTLQRCVA